MFNPAALEPYQPFFPPVPPPGTGVCDAPLVCVRYSESWQPYVLGALKALLMDSTWATTDPSVLTATRNAASDLILEFSGDGCVPDTRIDPDDPTYVDVSPDGTHWYRVPKPSDLSSFLVRNPNAIRNNGVIPDDGQLGILITTDQNTAFGGDQSGNFPALDLYTGAPIGRTEPLVRWGQSGLLSTPFLQLVQGGTPHDTIDTHFMYHAPVLSPDPSAAAATEGGLFIRPDGTPYIIVPASGGTFIKRRIGTGDGAGDGTLTDVTAHYTEGAPGSTPTLIASGSGATRHIEGTFPPIPDEITFDVDFTETDYDVDPSIVLTDSTVSGERTIDLNLHGRAVPRPVFTPPDDILPLSGAHTAWMMVDGFGSHAPFLVPADYTFQVIATSGIWSNHADVGPLVRPTNGVHTFGDFPFEGDLKMFKTSGSATPDGYYALDNETPIDPFSLFVATEDCYLLLLQHFVPGGDTANDPLGQIYVKYTITAPAAPVYDWHIDLSFIDADDRQNASFNFSGGAGTWVSGEGYGAVASNGSVELRHLSGDSTTTVAYARAVCKLADGAAGTGSPDVQKYLYVNNGSPYIFNAVSVAYVNTTYDMHGTIAPVVANGTPTGGGIVQNPGTGGTNGRISISEVHAAGFGTPPTFHP